MPSLTAYSCPQFPQTNFPLRILVSINNKCKSFKTCVGSPSSCSSPPPPLITINASASGTSAGKFGNPNYQQRQRIHTYTNLYTISVAQKEKRKITHFIRDSLHRRPIKTRKDILDKQRIQVEFDLLEFGFLRMERKCCGRGFAGFARASEEVEGEEFHCVFSLSSFLFFSRLLLLLLACLWDVRVGGFLGSLAIVCVCRICCSRGRFRREVVSLENTYLHLPGTFFSRGR